MSSAVRSAPSNVVTTLIIEPSSPPPHRNPVDVMAPPNSPKRSPSGVLARLQMPQVQIKPKGAELVQAAILQKNFEFLELAFHQPNLADVLLALETQEDRVLQIMVDGRHRLYGPTPGLTEAIEAAVAAGRVNAVKLVYMLVAGSQNTMLKAALRHDSVEIIQALAALGAKIYFKQDAPATLDAAVDEAIKAGRTNAADAVLRLYVDDDGRQPRLGAQHAYSMLQHGRVELVEKWLKSGKFAFWCLCRKADLNDAMIAILLANGFKASTLASNAAVHSATTLQNLLRAHRVEPDMVIDESISTFSRKKPLIYFAADLGGPDVVAALLEHNADPNKRMVLRNDTSDRFSTEWEISPLYAAAERGCVRSVQLLLQAGANPSFGKYGKNHLGNVHHCVVGIAVKKKHPAVVRELLQHTELGWMKRRKYLGLAGEDAAMQAALETVRVSSTTTTAGKEN